VRERKSILLIFPLSITVQRRLSELSGTEEVRLINCSVSQTCMRMLPSNTILDLEYSL
jgi:hypothetical protein